ncbi:MAG: MmgE/PrpD family protein [Hyphomicrobiales bacterium]|nr:MmgE/PrpD family protein [Hyphomicrobiales bacterium]
MNSARADAAEIVGDASVESVEEVIARHIVRTELESLPTAAVQATKAHILHTVATTLAGSSAPGVAELVEVLRDFEARPVSTIIGWDLRVPPAYAAMANSLVGHALDFDNNDDRIAYKSSVCAVPAALAVAEYLGSTTGRDVLTAACVGIDLGIRMGLSVKPYPSHSQSPELGPFAAAVAAAKLMKLHEDQVWDALGLALCGVATVGVTTSGMSYSKRFEAGAASRNGVFAALLASKGFKARQPVFVGHKNYFNSVWKAEADLDVLFSDLGKVFEIVNVGPKPYPSCRYTHPAIDGALALAGEHDIRAEDIHEVLIAVGCRDFEVVFGGSDGLGVKQAPPSIVDAQFSIPYTVATAIINRRVFVDDFSLAAIRRPEVLALARKVKPIVKDDLDHWPITVRPCEIRITTHGGNSYARRVEYARGNPRNPIPLEEIRENFVSCAQQAAFRLSDESVIEARDMIQNLEGVDDIDGLLGCLRASDGAMRRM